MTGPRSTLEDRLHAALDAEAAHVHPDGDAALGPIRTRVAGVRRRRGGWRWRWGRRWPWWRWPWRRPSSSGTAAAG